MTALEIESGILGLVAARPSINLKELTKYFPVSTWAEVWLAVDWLVHRDEDRWITGELHGTGIGLRLYPNGYEVVA